MKRLTEAKNGVKIELEQIQGEVLESEKEYRLTERKVKDLEFKTQVLESGLARELAFENKLKEFGFLYQSDLKPEEKIKLPLLGEMVSISRYQELEKKYEVALEQNEKLKMTNKFNPVYQDSLRKDLEKKCERLEKECEKLSENAKTSQRLEQEARAEKKDLAKENNKLRAENEKLTKHLNFFKDELKETVNAVMELRKATKEFLAKRDLTAEYNKHLIDVKFKWSHAVRRAIEFSQQKVKDLMPQQKPPVVQKQKSKGMER